MQRIFPSFATLGHPKPKPSVFCQPQIYLLLCCRPPSTGNRRVVRYGHSRVSSSLPVCLHRICWASPPPRLGVYAFLPASLHGRQKSGVWFAFCFAASDRRRAVSSSPSPPFCMYSMHRICHAKIPRPNAASPPTSVMQKKILGYLYQAFNFFFV